MVKESMLVYYGYSFMIITEPSGTYCVFVTTVNYQEITLKWRSHATVASFFFFLYAIKEESTFVFKISVQELLCTYCTLETLFYDHMTVYHVTDHVTVQGCDHMIIQVVSKALYS